jgi:ribose 5-phosphate isomerase B
MSKIFFASDHAGFELKEKLVAFVRGLGYEVEDMGAHAFNPEDDYPDFVTPLAQKVASDTTSFGIIIGKSGQGEAMCANRVKGIRAAVFYGGSLEIVQLAREHNNANILSLGSHFLTEAEAREAVKRFLELPFSDYPRHARRLAKF